MNKRMKKKKIKCKICDILKKCRIKYYIKYNIVFISVPVHLESEEIDYMGRNISYIKNEIINRTKNNNVKICYLPLFTDNVKFYRGIVKC